MSISEIDLVVQISGKRGAYIERVSLGPNGLTIGRAWDSDIIIQDKYVDAVQLALSFSEQGAVVVEDLDSTHGSMLSGRPLTGQALDYRWGDKVRVGDTTIRIFDVASQVEETASRSIWYSLQKQLDSWRVLTVIAIIAIVISTLSEWAYSQEPVNTWDFVVALISNAAFLLVWTLIFGSIGKLVQGQSNMRAHLGLISLAIIVVTMISVLLSVVLFNLQSPNTGEWLSLLLYGSISFIFCLALLTYTTNLSSRAKWIGSLVLVGGTIVAIQSDSFLKEEHELWSYRSNSEQVTLPPAFMLRGPVVLDDYFEETNRLFDRVIDQD